MQEKQAFQLGLQIVTKTYIAHGPYHMDNIIHMVYI